MGVAFSSMWSSLFGSKELKICILGLDNAGKTTLMYKMTLGSVVSTAPTVGSNTENFEYKNLKFTLWDVGGQTSLRTSWSSYLVSTDAVIFVLDSNDRERVNLAREELHRIAQDEQVTKAPILVWANKQDIKGAMTPAEISSSLALTAFRERTWQIFGCSALTGKGLTDGLDWLASTLGAKA
ncbi:probable ARL1 - ADP-ribosylation factor [Melanopsichium pennsylvanicum]|uniref:Probable ARL1 - ADP-ribosylation factor n=2 Tax=Melanopsichium pennsylvanicum TaxID=63383 RepID=A0AAJ5C778_9BASI|nr:probable ARL1-ADP-ribosylation factor [Melanopsichium pennsylvanicum 4]SNX86625.1 probable ARL1 - ADP-ribosylation factor [Melanopsichium pennsylvanicum]